MFAGFLFKTSSLTYPQAFLILGAVVLVCSPMALMLRFSEGDELNAKKEIALRLLGTFPTQTATAAGD